MDPSKIYHGPIVRVEIGGHVYDALGNGSAEVTFEPKSYDLADGQSRQLYGLGKVKVELAYSDAATINDVKAMRNTLQTIMLYTKYDDASNYRRFVVEDVLVGYSVKRGFGDEPHILTITGQKKAQDENDFVDYNTATSGGGAG